MVQGRGSIAPFSCVPVAISNSQTVMFFLAEDGFYAFDGTTAQPIGQGRIDKTILDQLSRNYMHRTYGFADPTKKLVLWAFSTDANAGNFESVLVYNWAIKKWSLLNPTELGTKSGEFATLLLSAGYTLDALDTLGYTLDTLPFSLDSRVWTGGAPSLAYFDSDHKLRYWTGDNLAARIDTAEFDGGSGRRLFCSGIRPIGNSFTSSQITARVMYDDSPNLGTNLTTATNPGADGVAPQRVSARYMRARVDTLATAAWAHLQGIEATIRPEGLR